VSTSDDVAAVVVRAADPWGFRLEATGSAALVAVTRGGCWLRQPGARPVELRAGDVGLVPMSRPGDGLASAPDGELVPYDVILSGSAGEVGLSGSGVMSSLVHVAYETPAATRRLLAGLPDVVVGSATGEQHGGLEVTARLLCEEVVRNDPGSRTAINRLVDVLVVHLLRTWMADHPNGSSWSSPAPVDEAVGVALDRIHTEPAHPWTIGKLAAEVGISRAAFVRRFTAVVGEPPAAYVTRWRLATAARRLGHTTEPLAVIAREVGYSSEFTFSRAFTRVFGQPPGRYRAEVRRRAKE
jgi:AraC-like DNA-binding protein